MRTASWLVALLATVLGSAACAASDVAVKLDGSPRRPEIEGVVVKASANGITFDGNRRFAVSKDLMTFSTYNRKLVPLASMVGSYVQGGLDGKTVEWLSKIGPVTSGANDARTVQYQGDLVKIDGRDLIFRDGTVLRLKKGLTAPSDALGPSYVVIDANRHVVQGATFAPARTNK